MKFAAGIAMGILAAVAWSQDENQLTPRELFYIKAPANTPPKKAPDTKAKTPDPPVKPPDSPPVVQATYTPLALKYSILERKGTDYEEVDSDTEFHSGDHIKVRAEANVPAYLYIVMGGSSGQWQVLFPSKEIDDGNNRIEPGQVRTIPFYFDETAGVEKLSLVLTRSPERDLEKLIYAAGDPTRKMILAENRPIDGAVVGHLRDQVLSRDLVFEKCDGTKPDCAQDKAVYAATKDKSDNAELFVDLKLIHK